MRKDYKVLRTGTIQFLSVNQGDQKLIIERSDEKDCILILLNASENEESFILNVHNEEFEDLLTGEKFVANSGVIEVILPPKWFSLLTEIRC
ncbi:Neopullulanase [compost metagenome]